MGCCLINNNPSQIHVSAGLMNVSPITYMVYKVREELVDFIISGYVLKSSLQIPWASSTSLYSRLKSNRIKNINNQTSILCRILVNNRTPNQDKNRQQDCSAKQEILTRKQRLRSSSDCYLSCVCEHIMIRNGDVRVISAELVISNSHTPLCYMPLL